MGQTLSSPNVVKTTQQGGNVKFMWAVSEMQGWRITMEDAHVAELNLDSQSDDTQSNTFFAVYDGHGGSSVAKYAGEHVHKRLIEESAYKEGQYPEALKRAFLDADMDMKTNPTFMRDPAGCTAVAALVTSDNRIFVANAGDSRSVLSSNGIVKALSIDHKPQNATEKARIVAAGGFIEFGRVNGNLALARALGDFDYKKNARLSAEAQIITADPEIIEHSITEDDEFIIVACDGIWDCLSSQQAVDCVRLLISQGKELPEICEILCDHCLAPDTTSGAGIGCDNMTMMVVALLHGRTPEQWYAWVKERVEKGVGRKVPSELPTLYSTTRILNYKARKAEYDERQKRYKEIFPPEPAPFLKLWQSGFFDKASGADSGLMFDGDDDDDDIEAGEPHTPKVGSKTLKQQLDELDGESQEMREAEQATQDADGDAFMHDEGTPEPGAPKSAEADKGKGKARELQGEAPPPPGPATNGTTKPDQLVSEPGGDMPSDAVRAEGLLDASEEPLKV